MERRELSAADIYHKFAAQLDKDGFRLYHAAQRITYERAVLGKVDTTTAEYRAFREAICADALGRMGLAHLLKTKEKGAKEVGHER